MQRRTEWRRCEGTDEGRARRRELRTENQRQVPKDDSDLVETGKSNEMRCRRSVTDGDNASRAERRPRSHEDAKNPVAGQGNAKGGEMERTLRDP